MTDPSGATAGRVDLHNHLVPGVDDGARTLEEAIEGVQRMVAGGVDTLVCTPHLDASVAEHRVALDRRLDRIAEAREQLAGAVRSTFPDVRVLAGFEILLDVPAPQLRDRRLGLAGTRFVLVEWPHLRVPRGTLDVLARLREDGLAPIIAHPERYRGFGGDMALAYEWKRAGAFLQVNHGSLHGRYGKEARSRALELLRQGWVDLMASDFHGRSHLETWLDETVAWFAEQGEGDTFRTLVTTNPRRVITDQDPVPVPPMELPRGTIERIRSLFQGGSA